MAMDTYHIPKGKMLMGQYIVQHRLRTGHNSTIYLVSQRRNGNLMAMKVSKAPESRAEWLDERIGLSKLYKCQYINKIIDHFGGFNSAYYIVLEHGGEELGINLLRSIKFNEANSIRFAFQLLSANFALQAANYTHKSINTQSVMICMKNQKVTMKLVDLRGIGINTNWKKNFVEDHFTSLNVLNGHNYIPSDDLFSSIYVISEAAGIKILDSSIGLIEAKKKFHDDPFGPFGDSYSWIPRMMIYVIEKTKNTKTGFLKIVEILETALPNLLPTSDITFEIEHGKPKIQ